LAYGALSEALILIGEALFWIGGAFTLALMLRALGSPIVAWGSIAVLGIGTFAVNSDAAMYGPGTQALVLAGMAVAAASTAYAVVLRLDRYLPLACAALGIVAVTLYLVATLTTDDCVWLLCRDFPVSPDFVDMANRSLALATRHPVLLASAVFFVGMGIGAQRGRPIVSSDFRASLIVLVLLYCVTLYVSVAYKTNPPHPVQQWTRDHLWALHPTPFEPFKWVALYFLGLQLGSTVSGVRAQAGRSLVTGAPA